MPVNENKGGVPALCGLLLGVTFHINSKQKKQLRKFEKKCIMEKNTLHIQGHKTDIANVPNEITKWAEVARTSLYSGGAEDVCRLLTTGQDFFPDGAKLMTIFVVPKLDQPIGDNDVRPKLWC